MSVRFYIIDYENVYIIMILKRNLNFRFSGEIKNLIYAVDEFAQPTNQNMMAYKVSFVFIANLYSKHFKTV